MPQFGAVAGAITAAASVASTIYSMAKKKPANPSLGISLGNAFANLADLPIGHANIPKLTQDFNLGDYANQFKQQNAPALLSALAPQEYLQNIPSVNLGAGASDFQTPNYQFRQFRDAAPNPEFSLNQGAL